MTQHQRQQETTRKLIAARQERMERQEANEGFAVALDMFGPAAMLDVLSGHEMITQYPAEYWDDE
jgi:hypothetical protein